MIATASPALLEALALQRAPRGRRPGPGQRLPDGTLHLVRLAAGEEEAISFAQQSTGESAQTLREAAIFYIQQVFFAQGSSSYRVLGVDADVSDERLREHYRWLARWLHPDRNPDQWEVVFAERVNNAWQDLRTSERRARYQPDVDEEAAWSAVAAVPAPHIFHEHPDPIPAPATRSDLRWLPSAVVAVLGSVAIAVVVLFYSSQGPEPGSTAVAATEAFEVPTRLSETPPAATAPAPIATQPAPAVAEPAIEVDSEIRASAVADAQSVRPLSQPEDSVASAAPAVAVPKALPPPLPKHTLPPPVAAYTRPQALTASSMPAPPPPVPAVARLRPPAAAVAATTLAETADPARSAPVVPEVPAPREEGPKPGSRDANRLLGQLSRAYEAGDVQGMRALFAADASGPKGNLEATLAEYRRVFAASSERSLNVRDVSWFLSGDTFTIVATFEASVTEAHGGRVRKTRGDLRLDLRRDGDRWQIFRMQNGERPG
jgi:hypothetical protein